MAIEDLEYNDDGTHLKKCLDKAKSHYTIKDSVKFIDDDVFAYCPNLSSIAIPLNVRKIGISAFKACMKLSSIIIPQYVESIGRSAFEGCVSLKSVIITSLTATIGPDTFKGCTGLTTLAPDSILNEFDKNFLQAVCPNVAYAPIKIPGLKHQIDKYAFRNCTGLTVAIIGDEVKKIEEGAFQECKELTWLCIVDGDTSIEDYAFADCNKLKDIKITSQTPPKCSADAFHNVCTNSCTLHVPPGNKEAYSNATVWKDFKISEYGWPTYKV